MQLVLSVNEYKNVFKCHVVRYAGTTKKPTKTKSKQNHLRDGSTDLTICLEKFFYMYKKRLSMLPTNITITAKMQKRRNAR